jgi:hypothetical protein
MSDKYINRKKCVVCFKPFNVTEMGCNKMFCSRVCKNIELMLVELFDGPCPHRGRTGVKNKIEHLYLSNKDFRVNVKALIRQGSEHGTFWKAMYNRVKDRPLRIEGQEYKPIDWSVANRMIKSNSTWQDVALEFDLTYEDFKRRFFDEHRNVARTLDGRKVVLNSLSEYRLFLQKKFKKKEKLYKEKIILTQAGRIILKKIKYLLPFTMKSKYRLSLLTYTGDVETFKDMFRAGGVDWSDSYGLVLQAEINE